MMSLVMNFSIAQNVKIKVVKEKLKGVSNTKREYQVIDNGIDPKHGYSLKHGYYKEFFKRDVVVSGRYKHDQKEGEWIYKDPEENYLQKGTFHEGKKVGLWYSFKKDVLSSKEYYNDKGRLDSILRYNNKNELVEYYSYDPINKVNYSKEEIGLGLKKEVIRTDSIKEKVKLFYPNGQLLEERAYENERLIYISDIYDINGNVLLASQMNGGDGLLQTIYLDDVLDGKYSIRDKAYYKNGIPDGAHTIYSNKGKLVCEGVNKEGFPFGKWKNWSSKKKKYTFITHTLNSKKKIEKRKVFSADKNGFNSRIVKGQKTIAVMLMKNRDEDEGSQHKLDFSVAVNESVKEYVDVKEFAKYFPVTKDEKYKIYVMFKVDVFGEISEVKVKSASKSILVQHQVEKALSKLPVLIPACLPESGKFVNLLFSLPIVFSQK